MSSAKLWIIVGAFIAGVLVTPVLLIAMTGGDDEGSFQPSPPPLVVTLETARSTDGPSVVAPAQSPATPIAGTPVVAPTQRPAASPTVQAGANPTAVQPGGQPLATQPAALNGRFRITDTITQGEGTGLVISFDVDLQQTGSALSGGNSEIRLNGQVEGATARVQFVQPALGYTGSFVWTLGGAGGAGTFTTSVPNSGTSTLIRLQ